MIEAPPQIASARKRKDHRSLVTPTSHWGSRKSYPMRREREANPMGTAGQRGFIFF